MQLQASKVSFRAGYESAFGTVATTMYELPVAPTIDFGTTRSLNQSSVIDGNRSVDEPFAGFKDGRGSVSVPVDNLSFGFWLKAFFTYGTPVDNLDGTYTHRFIVDGEIPTLTAEISHTDKANTFFRHLGMKGNTLSFSYGSDDELLANMEFIGKDSTSETTQVAVPSTVYKAGTKFNKFQNILTGITDASVVSDLSIDYSNNIDDSSYVINDAGARHDAPLGQATTEGTVSALFEGGGLEISSENFTTETVTSTFTSGTNILVMTMEKMKLEVKSGGVPIGDSSGGLTAEFAYQAFNNGNVDNTLISFELTNTVASY